MSVAAITYGVCARVPAKINLGLRVGPLRDDGFHELATVYHAVGLYDEVEVNGADDFSVETTGLQAAQVPDDDTHLALRAARLLAQYAQEQGYDHVKDQPVEITVRKGIPVAGGMAGGSADAAAALVACDAYWGLRTERSELERLAAQLGSDVPFLLHGGTALGSGRGEAIVPALARGTFHWVLALTEASLSTPEVYRELDRLREGQDVPAPEPDGDLMAALRGGDADALGRALHNDLQEPAFALMPELRDVVESGLELGAVGGIVSGSGPSVAFLTTSSEAAIDLTVGLSAQNVASDVRRVTGPVHGAHVVGQSGMTG